MSASGSRGFRATTPATADTRTMRTAAVTMRTPFPLDSHSVGLIPDYSSSVPPPRRLR